MAHCSLQARIDRSRTLRLLTSRLAFPGTITPAVLSEEHLLVWILAEVLVLGQELATVLLVSQSHASIFICQSLEKLHDILIVFELMG